MRILKKEESCILWHELINFITPYYCKFHKETTYQMVLLELKGIYEILSNTQFGSFQVIWFLREEIGNNVTKMWGEKYFAEFTQFLQVVSQIIKLIKEIKQ